MEDLAFRRLLDFYYLHELPIKQREIARKIGLVEHEQEVLTVLDEFFVSTSDGRLCAAGQFGVVSVMVMWTSPSGVVSTPYIRPIS